MGNGAIKMSVPSSPSVNLLTSAGELASDGLPKPPDFLRWRKTLGDLLQIGPDLAGDYVAYNFAWKPLVSEIRGYYAQVVRHDAIIREAKSPKNSRVIKTGYNYPANTASSVSWSSTQTGARWHDGVTLGRVVSSATSVNSSKKTWFRGKYVNFSGMPKAETQNQHDMASYAKEVLGLEFTPEVLWNLSPWSWFADWLTNTDVLLSSVSSALSDGMVPVEGFVMCHTRQHAETVTTGPPSGRAMRFSPMSSERVRESKKRFISTPYLGFNSVGSLTAKQLSILAALGISRA
jgi:hypothetical protein